jgi:hypothetical protein
MFSEVGPEAAPGPSDLIDSRNASSLAGGGAGSSRRGGRSMEMCFADQVILCDQHYLLSHLPILKHVEIMVICFFEN